MTPYSALIRPGKHFGDLGPSPIDFSPIVNLGIATHLDHRPTIKFDPLLTPYWALTGPLSHQGGILGIWNHHQSISRPLVT